MFWDGIQIVEFQKLLSLFRYVVRIENHGSQLPKTHRWPWVRPMCALGLWVSGAMLGGMWKKGHLPGCYSCSLLLPSSLLSTSGPFPLYCKQKPRCTQVSLFWLQGSSSINMQVCDTPCLTQRQPWTPSPPWGGGGPLLDSLTFPSEIKVTPPQLIPRILPLFSSTSPATWVILWLWGARIIWGRGLWTSWKANVVIKDSQGPLVKGSKRIWRTGLPGYKFIMLFFLIIIGI